MARRALYRLRGWRATVSDDLAHRHRCRGRRGRRDPPDPVADIVGDEQAAGLVDRHADRPPLGIAVLVEKAGEHVDRLARSRLVAGEGHEHNLVARARLAVPRAMLADERAIGEARAELGALGEAQA